MNKTTLSEAIYSVLEILPPELVRKIKSVADGRVGGIADIKELRIRSGGASFAHFSSGAVKLCTHTSEQEVQKIIKRITRGSLYAFRDTITRGYIPMDSGIRVGVCGHARYDGGEITVSDISSLVFRIPGGRCDFAEELYLAYQRSVGGILIYSPPGIGKTTALRSLAGLISRRDGRRVVVVDERSEFDRREFDSSSVDVLSGYSRKEGIELALRTLSPEVIMVDELMGDECREVEYSFLSGIPVIATAHAGSLSELLSKRELAELISRGVFSTFVGIRREGGRYSVSVSEDTDGCLNI